MTKFDLKSFFKLAVFIYIPFILLSILLWFFVDFLKFYIKEMLSFGIVTFFIFIIFFFIPIRLRKLYLLLTQAILLLIVFIKIILYYSFNSKLSASLIYVLFDTDNNETLEFIQNYFNFKTIVLTLFLLLLLVFSFYTLFIKKQNNTFSKILQLQLNTITTKLIAISLLFISGFVFHKKLTDESVIMQSYFGYKEYISFKEELQNVISKKGNANIKAIQYSDSPQTYVVIIGESTSKKHLQLYDYKRETNPLLNEIKKELILFKDVITPHVHTVAALKKIVTLAEYNKKPKDNFSVIQLSNKAKFSTYWLSNQKRIGWHENALSLLARAAQNNHFLNFESTKYINPDGIILPKLKEILQEKAPKKLIFIHLMGTHFTYEYRYPKEYNYFKTDYKFAKFKQPEALKQINYYDNAVRYNDYVVRSIIDQVKALNNNSYVLYFSDHGDEVFDTINFKGHNEGNPTAAMYEVPFMLWMSNTFKATHSQFNDLNAYANRKYLLEDFIHSFSDLSSIKFEGYKKEKSIFNSAFKMKPRIIKNGMNYDKEK